jgi:hypothetical protein
MNNPGYSVLDMDNTQITNVEWRFFQLYEYSLTRTVASSFITVRPEQLFNVRFGDASSIREFVG